MELFLFLLAMLWLMWGGLGVVWLTAAPDRKQNLFEDFSLAFLFGSAVISISLFILGWLLSGLMLRMSVCAICLLLGTAGFSRWRRSGALIRPLSVGVSDSLFALVLLVQIGFVCWLSARSALLWDGLFNWEIKAQLAWQNGGRLPLEYFSSSFLKWSHPEYPLLLPLTEAWIFGWLGAAHQGMIKLLFPFFYVAMTGLLAAGGGKISLHRRAIWALVMLPFFIPLMIFREGSLTSGYADFPLAVAYLAAVLWLADYWRTGEPGALRLMGCVSALLPWIKQEGAALWFCLSLLAALQAAPRRQWRALLVALLPGAVMIIAWMLFVRFARAPVGQDYLPLTFATLGANLHRIPVIAEALFRELLDLRHWSLLWPGLALASFGLRDAPRRKVMSAFGLAVALPLIIYLAIYLFISEQSKSLNDHLAASLPRLLLHLAPIALLFTWAGLTSSGSRNSEA